MMKWEPTKQLLLVLDDVVGLVPTTHNNNTKNFPQRQLLVVQ
jgi:hypothetical protein